MSKRRIESAKNIREKNKWCRRYSSTSSSSEGEIPDRHNNDENITSTPGSSSISIPKDVLMELPSGWTTYDVESNLDDDIALLGEPIHKDLAARWNNILVNGLPKESKEKLLKEYVIPPHYEMLLAPKLNSERKAALSENLVKQDIILETEQNQIGLVIATLSQAMDSIIKKDYSSNTLLKSICDVCHLQCDSHYNFTKTRKHLIISSMSNLNSEMKDALMETVRDKYLFGENVSEKLKSKLIPNKPGSNSRTQKFNKNITSKADVGSRKAQHQPRTRRSAAQHEEAVDRSPPPRQRSQRRL